MKNERIIPPFLLIVLLMIMTSAIGAAADRMPGVYVGDTFTYGELSFDWYSNGTGATPPAEWQFLNETEWIEVSVENVVFKNVTCGLRAHYVNGTEETDSGWIDVDTGDNVNMSIFLVSADLSINDSVYSSGDMSTWVINETVQKTYQGIPRETNHINLTILESNPPPYYYYVNVSMNVYWDRATGALTEMSVYSNQTTTTQTSVYFISMKLTGSSVWVVPESMGLLQTLLLVASLALVILANRRKNAQDAEPLDSSARAGKSDG